MRISDWSSDVCSSDLGESKASFTQGVRFLTQLTMLRFGRMSAFALVGGAGAIANLAIMWALIALGMEYVWAAIIASEELGRASCRERVCQYVSISVVAVSLNKK